jgi:hypothetical protein
LKLPQLHKCHETESTAFRRSFCSLCQSRFSWGILHSNSFIQVLCALAYIMLLILFLALKLLPVKLTYVVRAPSFPMQFILNTHH